MYVILNFLEWAQYDRTNDADKVDSDGSYDSLSPAKNPETPKYKRFKFFTFAFQSHFDDTYVSVFFIPVWKSRILKIYTMNNKSEIKFTMLKNLHRVNYSVQNENLSFLVLPDLHRNVFGFFIKKHWIGSVDSSKMFWDILTPLLRIDFDFWKGVIGL